MAAARLITPLPRARSVIQYQNQPFLLASSTVTQTRPMSASDSTTAQDSWGESGSTRRATYADAVASHRLALAVVEAARTGRTVTLPGAGEGR